MAEVALLLPAVPEACPLGLAPTTSTTVSLALGDALAVALLERKGFSAQEFRVLPRGGRLGSSLLRVADLLHSGDDVPPAPLDLALHGGLLLVTGKRHGGRRRGG